MLVDISLQLIYFIHSSLYLLIHYLYLAPPPFPLPLVTTSLFSRSVSLFLFCYIHLFLLFFRFHMWVITYGICLLLPCPPNPKFLNSIWPHWILLYSLSLTGEEGEGSRVNHLPRIGVKLRFQGQMCWRTYSVRGGKEARWSIAGHGGRTGRDPGWFFTSPEWRRFKYIYQHLQVSTSRTKYQKVLTQNFPDERRKKDKGNLKKQQRKKHDRCRNGEMENHRKA